MLTARIHRNAVVDDVRGDCEDIYAVLSAPAGPFHSFGGRCTPAGAQHVVDELEAACRRLGIEKVQIVSGEEPWHVDTGPIYESWERVGMVGTDETGYVEVSLPPMKGPPAVAVHIGALGQDAAAVTPEHAEVLSDHLAEAAKKARDRAGAPSG